MQFGWLIVTCLWICSAYAEKEYYDAHSDPPSHPGLLGIFTNPKIQIPGLDIFTKPKIPGLDIFTKPKVPNTGFQINKQFVAGTPFGGGSFGFGFGIGGHIGSSSPEHGVNVPPAEKWKPGKPVSGWEDKNKEVVGPRPNWGEEKEQPNPGLYEDKDKSKPETYKEEKKDSRPDWEDIGEVDHKNMSDDLMEGDLVGDGLIQPRLKKDRIKRFIDSKIYHVAFKKGGFISNARVSKVKFRPIENSLNSGM